MTEQELALDLEFLMRKSGGSGVLLNPIMASGPQSALPHAIPTERTLHRGDFVIFYFGYIVNGYYSDMTRTVGIGMPTEKQRPIYDLILKEKALADIAPGEICAYIDAIDPNVIDEVGYGAFWASLRAWCWPRKT